MPTLHIWSRKRSAARQGKNVRGRPAWTIDLLLLGPFARLDFLYKRDRIREFQKPYEVLSEEADFDVGEERRRNLLGVLLGVGTLRHFSGVAIVLISAGETRPGQPTHVEARIGNGRRKGLKIVP